MNQTSANPKDPIGWIGLVACLFLALLLIRLGTPARIYFDEVHYVKAAQILMEFDHISNREHPLLGKQLIAAGIALFGDSPWSWRIFSALAGGLTLFAFMRAMWFATLSRFAALAAGILLATDFVLFIQSRMAMLDVFMVCFAMVGVSMGAGAVRHPQHARWRLALAGIAMGLALGSKWTAAPVAALPGLAFLAYRVKAAGLKFLTRKDCGPIPGISLIEAGVWLGVVPVLAYLATFWPVFFYEKNPLTIFGYLEYHQKMWELQQQTIKPHPYMSRWYDWVLDWRPIWYVFENKPGAERGILFIGNPLTMIAGLPALAWCAYQGVFRKHRAALGVTLLYAFSLGMWIVAPKPVQFYYHYFLPSCFLMAALALPLAHWWDGGRRKLAGAAVGASVAVFAIFYPILSAMWLFGPYEFKHWIWLVT